MKVPARGWARQRLAEAACQTWPNPEKAGQLTRCYPGSSVSDQIFYFPSLLPVGYVGITLLICCQSSSQLLPLKPWTKSVEWHLTMHVAQVGRYHYHTTYLLASTIVDRTSPTPSCPSSRTRTGTLDSHCQTKTPSSPMFLAPFLSHALESPGNPEKANTPRVQISVRVAASMSPGISLGHVPLAPRFLRNP